MTAIIGIILIYFLSYSVMRIGQYFILVMRTKSWRRWTLKKSALAAGPFLLFGVIEFVSPTFLLTGYSRPDSQELIWRVPETDWTSADLTYAQAAELAPWLSHLGNVTRNEFEPTLLQARDRARGSLDAVQSLQSRISAGEGQDRQNMSLGLDTFANHDTLVRFETLNIAIEELDGYFTAETMSKFELRGWFLRTSVDVATRKHTEAAQKFDDATAAVRVYLEKHDRENATPEGEALSTALQTASSQNFRARLSLDNAKRRLSEHIKLLESITVEPAFPTLPSPIKISVFRGASPERFQTSRIEDYLLKGPNVSGNLAGRILSAFKQDNRLPKRITQGMRCYVAIVDAAHGPQHETACELHVPVRINYDLTTSNCPVASPQSCVERWVLPDLTMVVRDSSLTLFEPHPTPTSDSQQQGRVSKWEVSYNGVTKPLDGEARFETLPGQMLNLRDIQIRHIARQDAGSVRIWRDFELAAFGAEESALLSAQQYGEVHGFSGHAVGFNWTAMSFGSALEQFWPNGYGPANADHIRTSVRTALYATQRSAFGGCIAQKDADIADSQNVELMCYLRKEHPEFGPLILANSNDPLTP